MTASTETKKLIIQDVVVKISDVQQLASVFPRNNDNKTSIGRKIYLSFTTELFDGTKRSSKDPNIFSEDFPKRVGEIEMSYWTYGNDDAINIRLYHGGYSTWDSYVKISGQDSNWVNGTLEKFKNIISGMEPQPRWLRKHLFFFGFISGFGVGLILWYIFIILWYILIYVFLHPGSQKSPLELLGVEILLKYYLSFLFGGISSVYFATKLEELYPTVELQIGREHTFWEKRTRKNIKSVILLVFLPLITAAAYDLIKLVF